MKGRWKKIGAVLVVLVLLAAVRIALEPRKGSPPQFAPDSSQRARIRGQVTSERLDQESLATRLTASRVVLLGEEHFTNELPAYGLGVIEKVNARTGRPVVLLLELPQGAQSSIEKYMRTGDEADFASIWENKDALPYQQLIRWARRNPSTVRRVIAMDENRGRVILMRALLNDTRNQSMANAILQARHDNPDATIVAYGGQLHMTLSGRYLYDVSNREPAGARLLRMGIPRSELTVVLISGANLFPIADAWTTPGAVEADGALGELPYSAFFSTAIFGVEKAGELFDYFVNVGPLTQVSER